MTYFLIANIVVEKQGISIENKRPLGRKVKEVKIEEEPELVEMISQEPNKSQLVKDLLKKHYGI